MKQNLHNEKLPALKLIIDGKHYEWHQQYITGAEVRRLGNIPREDEIFLKIKEPWEDEPISDDTNVDLARPGIEHFFSKVKFPITIIVNGREKSWGEEKISYEQVVKLAFENYVENAATAYTVTYDKGPRQNPEGTMVKGDNVFVKNKMRFNVTATNQS
ncbi:MAG: multiubiquitin domain-containing protein [Bacteroidales bacterium]|nr:multiubiquitin domain-containing protein [Bacteroidales bacterium]